MGKSLTVVFAALLVLGACGTVKPGRIATPEQYGMTCPTPVICLEDPSQLARAQALRQAGVAFVEARLSPFKSPPRLLFCSTAACAAQFGDPRVAGLNLGTTGSLINPDYWRNYIVRHELIHQWQHENFGSLQTATLLPRWYIEGMAYKLSEDPRPQISYAQAQEWRAQFKRWIAAGNDWRKPPR